MAENSTKYQHLAAICVNIIAMGYGTVTGWLSPSLLILRSVEHSPLETGPVTSDEESWIASILCIGALFGSILFGWIGDRFGRKLAMLLVSIPLLISWILIAMGTDVTYLLIARFLGGISGGSVFSVIPIYITEISDDRLRGALGLYMINLVFTGILFSYVLGWGVTYGLLPYILMFVPIVFLCVFIWFPETPQQLMKQAKIYEAESSLRFYRNLRKSSEKMPDNFILEFQKIKEENLQKEIKISDENINKNESVTWDDFKTKPAIKSILIALLLMYINQFTGCFAMLNYTATIFLQAGSTLSPNVSAIIAGALQWLGSIVATLLVEKLGRKILLLLSTFGAFLGFLSLGLYTMFDNMGYDVTGIKWISLVSFSEILFVGALGVLTVPFIALAELSPPKIRGIIVVMATNLSWLMAFILVKTLPLMVENLGLHSAMFFFSGCSIVGALLTLAFLPETKGKSIDEIMEMLN